MYKSFGIDPELEKLSSKVEEKLQDVFTKIDKIKAINSVKVINAFHKYNLSEVHFGTTTGYGYGDVGRDKIEEIYADIFGTEDSLVRTQFISGTHALAVTLFALLRPKDKFLSINGKPYDTLDKIIGFNNEDGSLKDFGIDYEQIDLVNEDFDYDKIRETIKKEKIKLICIQRSKGYEKRKSIEISSIEKAVKTIKEIDSNIIIMVDNCYGEFVEEIEPTNVGADIAVGSLIKNPGGGIAPNGAYVVGRRDLIKKVSERLTAPGLGKDAGASLGINRPILQGLFFSPEIVANSLKTAVFASALLEELGYDTFPKYDEKRTDIIQAIEFKEPNKLIKFCQGIQKGSPVDAHILPEPWEMPGYKEKIIMACGAFVAGSSIELSCDAPIKEPYTAFLQGGLTYEYGKIGVLIAIQTINR